MSIFQQGAFTNDANMTPDQIKRKRELIAAMMPRFGSAKYVGEGIGQLATGFMAGRANKRMDKAEAAGRKSAEDMINDFTSRLSGQGGASGGGYMPSGTWTPAPPAPDAMDVAQGTMQGGMSLPNQPKADLGGVSGMGNAGLSFGSATMTPQEMLIAGSEKLGLDPIDVATAISYETGGKFDPMISGPTTQWGTHRGLIQFGEPQAAQYGADFSDPNKAMRSQLDPTSGAVWKYLEDTGVKSGMGLPEIYSAINAGSVGRMGASDANNGGAPGTVADKVAGMGDHRAKAAEFLGGTWTPNADVTASASGQPSAQPSGPGLDQLYMALQNPWLSPEQKAIITSMIGQQQQASDPMAAIELEKAQLELAQMKDPGTQAPEDYTNRMFTLNALKIDPQSEEGKLYILTGKMPEAPEAAPAPMTAQERAAWGIPETDTTPYAMVDGLPKAISGGGVTVNNDLGGNGAKPLGNEGQILVPDPTDPSGYRVELAPGSKAAMEAEAASNKSNLSADKTSATADVVLGKLDELDALLSGSSAFNPATGFGAETAANIGGTRAADTKAVIDTISGNLSFDNLAAMRASSPTGGALGAISDREITLLSSTLASLSQKQSPEQLARNVKQLREIYTTIKQKADAYPGAGAYGFGNTPDATAGAGVPEGIDPAVWAVMTPEERALWP